MEDERWAMVAVLDHLERAKGRNRFDNDLLSDAQEAIEAAYDLNMSNNATLDRYPLNDIEFPAAYQRGRLELMKTGATRASATLAASSAPASTSASAPASSSPPASSTEEEAFSKFVKRLKKTTTFFGDVDEGSDEYARRLSRARAKFDSKRAEKKQREQPTANSNAGGTPQSAKVAAEALKVEGNQLLKSGKHEEALAKYTECIALYGSNAVYYSNRAAANILLSRFSSAVDDCRRAIAIDKNFLRPRERLATAYRKLGMHEREIEALRAALVLEPNNNALKMQLSQAEHRLSSISPSPAVPQDGGLPAAGAAAPNLGSRVPMAGMAELARQLGNGGNPLESLMSNPTGMLSAMRDNPAMADMVQEGAAAMMNNPEAMHTMQQMMQMAGMFAGGGGGGGGGGGDGPTGTGGGNSM